MDLDVQVEGLAELQKQLQRLEIATAGKVLRSGARHAMRPVFDEIKANVQQDDGDLVNALQLTTTVGKGGFAASAGVRTKKKKAPHWHLIEFGTQGRTHKKGGKRSTGRVQARPVFRPAFDKHQRSVVERLREYLARRIKRELKKVGLQ